MKKILLTLSAVALVVLFACSKDDTPGKGTDGKVISFKGSPSATKASLPNVASDNYQFEWATGDKVSIWYTLNGGTSFTTRGEYNIITPGPSSAFEFSSGNQLTWDASGNPHTFLAVYPALVTNTPATQMSLGNGAVTSTGDTSMTQAVANVPNHITGVRALMVAKSDPVTPPADQSITQAVSLDFNPAWSYIEYRMSGTDDGSGRKIASIKITTTISIVPASDSPQFNIWTFSFPSYWNRTEATLKFGTAVDVSETVQKGWLCIQPNAGASFTFTINYTSGAPKTIVKTVPVMAAGNLLPVTLDVTPPALVVPHYTLTVSAGQSVTAAIAAAKTAGDIADNYEIQNIIYLPAAFSGNDIATLQSLMQSGSVDSITLTNLTAASFGGLFNKTDNSLVIRRIVAPMVASFGNYCLYYVQQLTYLDAGTVAQDLTSWMVVKPLTTLKLGYSGAGTGTMDRNFFSGWTVADYANCDLYLGPNEMANNVSGNVWTKTVDGSPKAMTFKSISAY